MQRRSESLPSDCVPCSIDGRELTKYSDILTLPQVIPYTDFYHYVSCLPEWQSQILHNITLNNDAFTTMKILSMKKKYLLLAMGLILTFMALFV